MGGAAQRDRPAGEQRGRPVQPRHRSLCGNLSAAFQGGRAIARDRGTHGAGPRHDEVDAAIAAQAGKPNGGFIVVPDGFMVAHHAAIAAAAAHHPFPAAYFFRAFTDAGGLLSYGNDIADNYRRAAAYADRILKGERAGELPVQFPVKFELVINLKAAKALDLDVPWLLQQRADEVIE